MENDYELLDFGSGRKLERWGEFMLDRPCPAAENFRTTQSPNLWKRANAKFAGDGGVGCGVWDVGCGEGLSHRFSKIKPVEDVGTTCGAEALSPHPIHHTPHPTLSLETAWTVKIHTNTMELKLSPFGHIGAFPEQIGLWQRITDLIAARSASQSQSQSQLIQVLNLFAYTGGSTLAAAAAGASVVHIDSAKNLLARARRNAELSGLAEAPIRWIAEDAVRFVQREIKRNSRYDAIILDPPSYGHGTGRNIWSLSRDLPTLLECCFELLSENPIFLLLSCHTPGYDTKKLAQLLKQSGRNYNKSCIVDSFPLHIQRSGLTLTDNLPAGFAGFALFTANKNLQPPASSLPPVSP